MRSLLRLAAAALAVATQLTAMPVAGWAAAPARRPHPHRKPWPITVTVQTVPALPGVRFTFDGRTLVTNAAGTTSYRAEHNFAKHTLALLDAAINQPTRRYRFARWAGQRDPNQAFRTTVTGLPQRANYTVNAAFTVQYPVTAKLVDQHGVPLDLDQVSAVTIKSDTGQMMAFPTSGVLWLDGITPDYRKSALVETTRYYSVQALTMNGTNIADAGRQRFTPGTSATVVVTGQLHDLTITARDPLFDKPLGTHAVVTGPDGKVQRVAFDATHAAVLHRLPRGTYRVTVTGTRGMVLDQQFTLSRDKTLPVAVLSRQDLAVLGGALLLLAASLLIIGRLRRLIVRVLSRALRFRRPRPAPEAVAIP